MLHLQRLAGNHAVNGLVAGRPSPPLPVQRLSVRPADLAPEIAGKSKVSGLFGRSTFASIHGALSDYEKARAPKDKARLLQRLDTLCTKWVNEHGSSTSPQDLGRRPFVQRLLDELPTAQAELSKSQAQDVYMSNVEHAGAKGGKAPGTKFALDALQDTGKMAAQSGASKEGNQLAQQKGLTPAEVAAIRIFSASDYSYINPATANSPSWMQAQKSKKGLGIHDKQDRTLMEEGSLHAGVAMQGLSKLDPWDKDAYRGARYTEAEFAEQFLGGKPMTFTSFASSAQDEQVALKFAHGVGIEYTISPDKDIAVICILSLTGGRDISKLSAVKAEKEVLILPGTSFGVLSVQEVDGKSVYPELVKKAQDGKQPLPKKWYVVKMARLPKQAPPPPPAPPPPSASGHAEAPQSEAPESESEG